MQYVVCNRCNMGAEMTRVDKGATAYSYGTSAPPDWLTISSSEHLCPICKARAFDAPEKSHPPEFTINPRKPHAFIGRRDRGCDACDRPDRNPIHNVDTVFGLAEGD